MTYRYAVLVVCVALAMVVAPTSVAQETATPTGEAVETATPTQNTTNGSSGVALGTQLTAFAQSSSAAANDSVENGMWRAGFDRANASNQSELVRARTGSLERRLERLQAQNESLQERYENGSISEQAYVARQSRLSARIDGLRTAVNDTDEAAARAGVNDTRLETLKRSASELRGPQTAAIARGLGGGPPANRGNGGPPGDDRGPPENRTGQRGNGANDAGPPGGNDAGPPGGNDAGPPGGNDAGPPGESDSEPPGGADAGPAGADDSAGSSSSGSNDASSGGGGGGGSSGGGGGGGGASGGGPP